MISIVHQSPVGALTLASNGKALTQLAFENARHPQTVHPHGEDEILLRTRRELDAYFAGRL